MRRSVGALRLIILVQANAESILKLTKPVQISSK
jgi:hypothetical protein